MIETIPQAASWLSLICISASLFGAAYALAAIFAARRHARGPAPPPLEGAEGVTILKPLYGAEPRLYENLRSFCAQDYPGPVRVVFGVQRSDDPALATLARLRREFPAHDLHIVVNAAAHGANHKVSNLINMSALAQGPIVLLADSDMRAPPDHLSRTVGALREPGVGLVTSLYHGEGAGGLWAELGAMAIDDHFLPSVLIGLATGLANPCFGSSIALRRDTLEAIGGFEAVADQLADDHAIGAAVRRLGLKIAIPARTIAHTCVETSLRGLWRHELRWARTIRSLDPWGYAGSGVSHALPFALTGAALRGFDGAGLMAIGVACACRIALQSRIAAEFELPKRRISLIALRDMLSFAIYVTCFFGRRVDWRGLNFVVDAHGLMHEATDQGKS